jgi:hypothetical protein
MKGIIEHVIEVKIAASLDIWVSVSVRLGFLSHIW